MNLHILVLNEKLGQNATKGQLEKVFINFQYAASCQYVFDYMMGACVFFATLRFIKASDE